MQNCSEGPGTICNDYTFNVEIKNVGGAGTDYSVSLREYMVDKQGDAGNMQGHDKAEGYLDTGDTTTVTLFFSDYVLSGYPMIEVNIEVFTNRYTDKWTKRIMQRIMQ